MAVAGSQSPRTLLPGPADIVLLTLDFTNSNLLSEQLRNLVVRNSTTGPGTQTQLDNEVGKVRLYLDDGDGTFETGQDVLYKIANGNVGLFSFNGLNIDIPAGSSVRLFLVAGVSLAARDGDAFDLVLKSASDITMNPAATFNNAFPVDPAGSFPIDGMVAAQISRTAVGPATLVAGTSDNLALDAVLPPDGYQSDILQQLTVANDGSARGGSDIAAMKVWVDNGNGLFEPTLDRAIAKLAFTGDRWQATGLSEPIPLTGLHLFLSVDVSDLANEGNTVRLAFPALPGPGVDVASTNDGPLDRLVENAYALPITNIDRVTLSAGSIAPSTVNPGTAAVPLLDLIATSTYLTPRTLTDLVVTNATRGAGPSAQLDGEIQLLTLRADNDGDGVLDATDPAIGTAFFSGGKATFSGLNWILPADSTRHLFVTGDVSLTNAADSDTLSANFAQSSDVTFLELTRVVGSFPVDSRSQAAVDGMVAAQIANAGAPGATLQPGEGPVLALDVTVPRNGYLNDALQQIEIVNLGSAGPSDVASVHLWRDGGDGVFSAGAGDDQDLGQATWQGSSWLSAPLTQPLLAAGARIFAGVTATATPTDGATLQLAIPLLSLTVATGNDGPIDATVQNPNVLSISNSPLLAVLSASPTISTVGMPVRLVMKVRNVGAESIQSVTPSALSFAGTGSFTTSSGPLPASVNLAPGDTDSLVWILTAATAGNVVVSASASGTGQPSGAPRQSGTAATGTLEIHAPATRLDAGFTSQMPAAVNLGETDVVPLSLTLTNPGGSSGSAVRLDRLRIRLEDGTGTGIVPSSLLSRIVVNSGASMYLEKTTLETGGADVDLPLATPVVITPSTPVTVTLRVDILSSATSPSFRVVIVDSTVFVASDATSGATVPVHFTNVTTPARTGVARLTEAATQLDVSGLSSPAQRVGSGAAEVPLMGLHLQNPGVDGITSDAQVMSFTVHLTDTSGTLFPSPGYRLSRIEVRAGALVVGSRTISPADGPDLTVTMSPLPTIPVSPPLDLQVYGDIAAGAVLGDFVTVLGDTSSFVAVDRNTQTRIPVFYASSPVNGDTVIVEGPADTLMVSSMPRFPPNLLIGEANVPAMTIRLRHPGAPGVARIRLDSLIVRFEDQARQPLVPAAYVSRLHVLWNGVEIQLVTNPPISGSTLAAPLPGPMIEPGDTARVDVIVDTAPTAPAAFLELSVSGNDLDADDANLGNLLIVAPEIGADLPLSSGLTHLQAPPRDLTAGFTSRMPAALAADGNPVELGELWLLNTAPPASGPIRVDHLVLQASDRNLQPFAIGRAITGLTALVADTVWAQSGALTMDSTTAFAGAVVPLDLAPDDTMRIRLRGITSTGASGTLRVGFDAAGIGVIQPSSGALQISVRPEQGRVFPLWTEVGSFSGLSLKDSYSNFPNPFAAGREVTSFAYYLSGDARVSLQILTPDGDRVASLMSDAPRLAGMHESDRWDGRNGVGQVVRNGVYIADLTVRYADGSSGHERRKLAVVR